MSNYYNRQWRLPNNENKDKLSNYSIKKFGSDYISTPLTIDEFSSATMSIWFKTSLSQNNKYFLSFPEASGGNGFDLSFVTSGIKSYLFAHSGDNNITSTFTYNDGNWHHVIVSYSGTNHKMYIDGVLTASSSASIGTIKNAEGNLYIGAFSNLYASFRVSNTFLDQVCVFNYALSDGGVSVGQTATGQIATLYGGGSAIGNPMAISGGGKPVAYYPLGDQDSFNGANYLVPNSSLKDYVFDYLTTNSYIDTNFTLPASYTSYSYSIWYKQTSSFTGDNYLIGNWNQGSSAIADMRVSVRFNGGTKLRIITGNNTTGYQTPDLDVSSLLLDGNWHHIAITVVSGEIKLYIDKNLEATHSNSNIVTGIVANRSYALGFSGNTSFAGYLDNSQLSNFQIFNTALPATGSNSVETLYNNGSPLTSMSGFSSLQGWWKLDASATYDSSTTTWTIPDDSTNSNDGTSSGMTQANLVASDLSFKTSISPFALSFDGVSDKIDLNSDISLTGSKTVSFWFKAGNISGNNVVIGGDQSSTINYYPYITSTSICLRDGTGFICLSGLTFSNNIWYHLCIVGDGTTATVYLNGQSQGTLNDKNPTINTIGAFSNSASAFTGSISNVSIWNAALTSSQVTELYSEGVPSNLNNHSAYSNLVSWWQLGSNSSFNTNWTVLDEKGSNNGTSVNMAEDNIVDGVGSYANGTSYAMSGDEVIGSAPFSDANSLSINMDVLDRTDDTPA